ncbi:hypothetical protein VCUG_01761 [Vavraia culicis subsp. floridensis]|uniref:Uncharacterized protein n=1 Tax=Vavraia culicis (isolate floridensis) TaxID=948595 RepID=L2GUF0_VAVCU|nr:uncharacterized protein VCUG_01761 [Vavraia culicis subsp. floridensis]ELA46735.1 hypothetical protein VCUG_01761 [Vavraia culicis subsp. floridensis]
MKIDARLFVNNANEEWLALFTGQINLFSARNTIVLTNNAGEYVLPASNLRAEKSGTTILILRNGEQYALSFDTERNRNLYYEFFNENVDFNSLEELGVVLTAKLSEFSVLYVVNKVISGLYIDQLVTSFDGAIFADLVALRKDTIVVELMEREKELLAVLPAVDERKERGIGLQNRGTFLLGDLYDLSACTGGAEQSTSVNDEESAMRDGGEETKGLTSTDELNRAKEVVTSLTNGTDRTVSREGTVQYSLNRTSKVSDEHTTGDNPHVAGNELLNRMLLLIEDGKTREYLRSNESKHKKLLLINKINRKALPGMQKDVLLPLLPYIRADIHAQKMFLRQYASITVEMFINDERTMAQIIREREFFDPFKEYVQNVLTYEKDNVRVTVLEILKRMMRTGDHTFLTNLFLCLPDMLLVNEFYSNTPPRIEEMMHSVMIFISEMHDYYALDFFLSTNLLKRMIGALLAHDLSNRVFVLRVILNLIRTFGRVIVDYVAEHKEVLVKVYESVVEDKNMLYSLMCALFILTKPHFDCVLKDLCE